jgi:sec-independent protein translocase protein TatA
MPFNLGPTEMIFVLVVLLLVFGAKRLPELGSGLGKGIREFRRSMKDITSEIERSDEPERIHSPAARTSVPPPASERAPADEKSQTTG